MCCFHFMWGKWGSKRLNDLSGGAQVIGDSTETRGSLGSDIASEPLGSKINLC